MDFDVIGMSEQQKNGAKEKNHNSNTNNNKNGGHKSRRKITSFTLDNSYQLQLASAYAYKSTNNKIHNIFARTRIPIFLIVFTLKNETKNRMLYHNVCPFSILFCV